ncbi:MAG: ABC transporter permease [Sphingobacteriales bacterium]|nr:ABC transporter permease [Sphingobacteriales bacterium]
MIGTIAWRNIWRNKVRSIIVLSAVAIGMFAGIFSTGFYKGMGDMRFKTAIRTEVSHIQLHHPAYLENKDIAVFMTNSGQMIEKIRGLDKVEGCSRRLISECMAETAHGTMGVNMIGVEPEFEKTVTDIHEKIIEGSYLDHNNSRIPQVLIGSTLAKELKIKIKSKVRLSLVDREGNIITKLYKVGGLYKTSNTGFDKMNIFVLRDEMLAQTGLPEDAASEIAVYLKDDKDVNTIATAIKKLFPAYETKTWREISKELSLLADQMDQIMYIFVIIIMLALCFGIINTMLMVVLERKRELGMLMAVGMSKSRVFRMIVLESVYLSFTGGIAGILIGYGVIKYFSVHPLKLEMFSGFEMYGYSTTVYTNLEPGSIIIISILVILLGIVSAIYPARKAIRLDPADAIRTE